MLVLLRNIVEGDVFLLMANCIFPMLTSSEFAVFALLLPEAFEILVVLWYAKDDGQFNFTLYYLILIFLFLHENENVSVPFRGKKSNISIIAAIFLH